MLSCSNNQPSVLWRVLIFHDTMSLKRSFELLSGEAELLTVETKLEKERGCLTITTRRVMWYRLKRDPKVQHWRSTHAMLCCLTVV